MLVASHGGMRTAVLSFALLVAPTFNVHADDAEPDDRLAPTVHADDSAAFGAFSPLVDSPAMPATVVKSFGVYDGARESTAYVVDAQARLASRLQLHAAARYEDNQVSSEGAVQLGVLDGSHHGVNLQLALGYSERGVNEVQAAFAELGLGHYRAGTYLFASTRFDLGLDDGERGGRVGIGSMTMIAPAMYLGMNGRLELDLERDATEPMNESSWSLQVGPALTYVIDRFAVTASGGLASDTPRIQSRELGAFGSVGVGAAF